MVPRHSVDALVDEPLAAALSVILDDPELGLNYRELAGKQTFLVFDLGGGTFELALVSYDRKGVRVLAKDTDPELGGVGWNRKLETHISRRFESKHGQGLRHDLKAL